MDYQSLTEKQLQAESIKIGKKIRSLHAKLEAYQKKIDDEIEALSCDNVEINRIISTRNHKPEVIAGVDWKALFAPVADIEATTDWQREVPMPGEVDRILALYQISPGEIRHVSADHYNGATGQPQLKLQFDHESAAKLDIYAELLQQIIPHIASEEAYRYFPAGVQIEIESPRDLDDRRPDGAPDATFMLFVRDDGQYAIWEIETSCHECGVYSTLREALQHIQDGLAFDGSENDYDWEPFNIDEFKEEHGVK
jgi:hypothetical protein